MLGAVHTTGVNPESLASILGGAFMIMGGFTAWVLKRIDSSTKTIAYYLGLRLDRVEQHADATDAEMRELAERVSAIEGPRRRQPA